MSRSHPAQSETEFIAWLRSHPAPEEVAALFRQRPYVQAELIAQHYDLSRFANEQLEELCRSSSTLGLLCLNPSLTDQQIKHLVFQALSESLQEEKNVSAGGNLHLTEMLSFLKRAGRKLPMAEIKSRLLRSLELEAERQEEEKKKGGRARGGGMGGFHLLRHFWYELTREDLELCLASQPHSTGYAADVLHHPRASLEMVLRLAQQFPKENTVMSAVAANPHIRNLPEIQQQILAERNPWACAKLTPYLSDEQVNALALSMAELHPARAATYIGQLSAEDRRRLRPASLLPLLQAEEAELRLKAQVLATQIGRDTPAPPAKGRARKR